MTTADDLRRRLADAGLTDELLMVAADTWGGLFADLARIVADHLAADRWEVVDADDGEPMIRMKQPEPCTRCAAIDAAVEAAGGAERVRTAGLCLAEMAEGTFGHDAAVVLRAVVGDGPCLTCEGHGHVAIRDAATGEVSSPERCPTCGGTGDAPAPAEGEDDRGE